MILKSLEKLHRMNVCADELASLGPDTEPEFLKIGETLNKLATICFGMTDDALHLTSLSNFSVEEEHSAQDSFIEETKKIFAEVAGHVGNSIGSLNEGDYLLVDLLQQTRKLREPVQKLYSIGKTFRFLGVSIKVESSRNANTTHGFRLLAEEVADIAVLIQDNCRYCTDKTDVVARDITTSQQVLNRSDNRYDDSGETAINNILSALADVGSRSEVLAAGIQERSSVMVQGISDVVMAMQFHDITRQQLENVSHALVEIYEKAGNIGDETSADESEQVALEVYGILSIQAAHLNSIYEQIINAREQIGNGLGKIMDQAWLQAKDAKVLLAMDGRTGQSSVIGNLEREIDNIVVSLNKSLTVVKDAAEVSRAVYDNVSEIGKFVNKIEEVAFDVKVLAINAMVEAIKTGDTGLTLKVLAQELSLLSQETRDGATDSIEMLKIIMEGTEKQLEFSTNLDQSREVVDEMIARAKKLTGTILSSMQEVGLLARKMDSSNQDLASRITQLVPGIKFPVVMGDRIDRNWQIICQIIDQIEDEYPQFLEKNAEVEQMHAKLAQQYVMDRERSIHAQVAGRDVSAEVDASGDIELFEDDGFELFDNDLDEGQQADGRGGDEDDFGENVELF